MKTSDPRPVVAAFRRVTQYFDSLWAGTLVRAVADVSFEVRRGEVFGLVGPPGSGKSTTLELLAGRLRPGEGKVLVFGRSPKRRKVRERIGYLPGEASASESPAKTRFSTFLGGMLRLVLGAPAGPFARSLPAAQRRALRLRLFFRPPDLLLLDEPFVGLDESECCEIKDSVLRLAQSGVTIVITSQRVSEVKDICTRVAIFFAGRVEAVGTVEELPALPDALRSLAPVLSEPQSEWLLQIIRDDLRRSAPLPSGPAQTAAPPSATLDAPSARLVEVLAPLTRPPAPARPLAASEPAVDPIDHEKLAQLTHSAES